MGIVGIVGIVGVVGIVSIVGSVSIVGIVGVVGSVSIEVTCGVTLNWRFVTCVYMCIRRVSQVSQIGS